MVLAGLEGPGQALLAHLAATAHLLGLLDLEDGRTGVADREEQLRVLVEARGTVAPIHGWAIPLSQSDGQVGVGATLRCRPWARRSNRNSRGCNVKTGNLLNVKQPLTRSS